MKRALLAAAFVVLVIAIVALRSRSDDGVVTRVEAPVAVVATRGAPPTLRSPIANVGPHTEVATSGISTDDPLVAFKKQNIYPPASRPLTAEHTDLLFPNRRHELPRQTEARDGTEMLFTADRYFVIERETVTPTLELRRNGKPVPFTVTQAFAAVMDPNVPDPPRYPFNLGKPFAPSAIPGLVRQAALGFYLEFQFGGVTQRTRIDVQYTPSVPARFTGTFRDGIANGSLVIHAQVVVARAGKYLVDCNLFDAQDRPIAWTRAKVDLAEGTHDVPLPFFGKVLVDQSASGAFHIGQLRGALHAPDRDPDLETMPAFAGAYTTRDYAASDFSDAEYDSLHKQEMIQFLTEQQQRGVHRGAAR